MLSRITVITIAAAVAGMCALPLVSASDQDETSALQADPRTQENPPAAAAETSPAQVVKASGVSETNEAPAPTPKKMSLEQLRATMADAEKRRQEAVKPDPEIDNRSLAEKWGVEVSGISRTAGGYMLDFRFRVVDAKKALPLFDHRIKPYLVAQKSDIKLPVPVASKVGAFRPTNRGKNIKADKDYYMIFANPDSHVKPGEKVSVIIGDFRVENLTVNE